MSIQEFPECIKDCELVKYFGFAECDSFCPGKFFRDGTPIKCSEYKDYEGGML